MPHRYTVWLSHGRNLHQKLVRHSERHTHADAVVICIETQSTFINPIRQAWRTTRGPKHPRCQPCQRWALVGPQGALRIEKRETEYAQRWRACSRGLSCAGTPGSFCLTCEVGIDGVALYNTDV
ncbi:hypothetical protein PYCCODRAFT_425715 [Trametes coccinea BRFM310]|uniref:Uncharacterized protein n=1 Tax=Trametes coccinea (strain BRFM310) TaxID=1353009 RepID=A0A1Y2IPY3_TRAC3|nr:hypothetical protein PYCCODRAFT_425715 [Trametes coccinea BRFM310]